MGFGTTEILIIAGIVVLLFGASAIPKFARNIGKAKREFEEGLKESGKKDDEDDDKKKRDASEETSSSPKEREL